MNATAAGPAAAGASSDSADQADRPDPSDLSDRTVGRWAPRRRGWSLSYEPDETGGTFLLDTPGTRWAIPAAEASALRVRGRRWRRPLLVATRDGQTLTLPGLSRRDGRQLARKLRSAVLEAQVAPTVAWFRRVEQAWDLARSQRRWVSAEQVQQMVSTHPGPRVVSARTLRRPLTELEQRALAEAPEQLPARAAALNAQIETAILEHDRTFFDRVESTPLTAEQARAVYTYDNRVQVLASAGSGKTSVMVGRAAYAVHRGFARPDQVLLLAFNAAAADELRDRTRARFESAGLDPTGLTASTFHAFGLRVIGEATGVKPTVAPWVDSGRDTAMIARIVADLRRADPQFARDWDTFRFLFARLADDPHAPGEPDAWDPRTQVAGFATLAGPVVRSHGERLLADWLYLHHVDFEYERAYPHQTATASRRQYRPDFYYPDIDTWHEHWGLDANGNPPPGFAGYAESMTWKKALHRTHGTHLLESTWAHVMDGTDFPRLARQLRDRGATLRWDPARAARHERAVPEGDLHRLVRTFMAHVKANSLTPEQVAERVATMIRNPHRARLFLRLYWPIHQRWQQQLTDGGFIDFEDMLLQAAEHVEAGTWSSPYELVMVDEFQDASRARARLTRALLAHPGRHLLAVGDDWQSINRFAGSDLSVVTHFHDYFGPGPTVALSKTFRCHESIATAAADFVMTNPAQQRKSVTSVHAGPADAQALEGIWVHEVATVHETRSGVAALLEQLDAAVDDGAVAPGPGRRLSVDVLGRYRFEAQHVPARSWRNLHVTFRTVHSAKGLEADYVVVPNMGAGTFGFPSQIIDDPVLALAMSQTDPFPHAEERRLFYVALTRARRGVHLLAPAGTPSVFVTELLTAGSARMHGPAAAPVVCPACRQGVLRSRQGRFGSFYGCSRFPACRHTAKDSPA